MPEGDRNTQATRPMCENVLESRGSVETEACPNHMYLGSTTCRSAVAESCAASWYLRGCAVNVERQGLCFMAACESGQGLLGLRQAMERRREHESG